MMNNHNTVRQMNKLRDIVREKSNIAINPAHIAYVEHYGLSKYPINYEFNYDENRWHKLEYKYFKLFGIIIWSRVINKELVTDDELNALPYHMIRVHMSDGSIVRVYNLTLEQADEYLDEFDNYVDETLELMDECVEESREEEASENNYPGVSG